MRGQVWKHNGQLVFCPYSIIDFCLGKPNDGWMQDEAGKILNLKEHPELKEGDEVIVGGEIYFAGYPEWDKQFLPYMFGCKVLKVNEECNHD